MEVDEIITGKSISNNEVTELYKIIPDNWVLLEPVEFEEDNNRVTRVKVLKYNKDKEILRDHLLDQDEWEGDTLIYFYTGHDGTCKI